MRIFATLLLVLFSTSACTDVINCDRTMLEYETMICADPALIKLNARIEARRKTLLAQLDAVSKKELQRNEQQWEMIRDQSFYQEVRGRMAGETSAEYVDFLKRFQVQQAQRPDLRQLMSDLLTRHADFLDTIIVDKRQGTFSGVWRNLYGEVRIVRKDDGSFLVSVQTVNPWKSDEQWRCNFEGVGRLSSHEIEPLFSSAPSRLDAMGQQSGNVLRANAPNVLSGLILERQGATLEVVQEAGADVGFCSSSYGELRGYYFLVSVMPD